MKITVIGHLARDVFHLPGDATGTEKTIESLGGISYSVATLATLCAQEHKIIPVCGVAEEEYESTVAHFERYGNVETKGLFKIEGPVSQAHYFCSSAGNRVECSKHIAPPIPFPRIKPHLDVDGVIITMTSGFDITLETLDFVRMQTREQKTPIHFDFHSLTLGIDENDRRFRRPLTDWRRWCFMANSIQMSEDETAGLTAERYDEPTLINQLMSLMVDALLITRGERGVTLIRQEHKKLFRNDLPGTGSGEAVDTIGCSGVFGAAFFYEYLRSKDYVHAATFAERAASLKSLFYGLDSLKQHLGAGATPE